MFGSKKVIVETYKGDKNLEKGMRKMAKKGYTVSSRTAERTRGGCLRVAMLGLIFAKPYTLHTVHYQLVEEAAE